MKSWVLQGLHCASCAEKIESRVQSLGLGEVALNPVSMELRIENPSKDMEQVLQKIVDEIEPGVKVLSSPSKEDFLLEVEEEKKKERKIFLRLGVGALLFLVSFFVEQKVYLLLAAYVILGYDILYLALHNLFKGSVLDENFLMGIATLGAIAIKEYPEAVAVMLFYQVGEFLQEKALSSSKKSIKALLELRPDEVTVRRKNQWVRLSPEELVKGDLIKVLPGERVAVDSVVYEGESHLDHSAITGESLPVSVGYNDAVFGGSINLDSPLELVVKRRYEESTLARILNLVQEASFKKAPVESFIRRFAKIYTPAVVAIALLLALVPSLLGYEAKEWIHRALIFLVISCPCGLVISVPLSFFAGIGKSSSEGILIKGGTDLETLSKLKGIVFDKTGTLTKGEFRILDVEAKQISKRELVKIAASLESHSNHPIAKSIYQAHDANYYQFDRFVEKRGKGIEAYRRDEVFYIGSADFLKEKGYSVEEREGSYVHIARGKDYLGHLQLGDKIREGSQELIAGLHHYGISSTMLSGDKEEITQEIANRLGIDQAYGELLPEDKVKIFEQLQKTKQPLAFVGDGINDAPVLSRSDLGIAMGGLGSDAAIEAADVVLMEDEPRKILRGIELSRRTMKILWQNILFIFGVKGVVLTLGALGIASMWMAVFADVGVTLLAILNSLRIYRD